MRPRKTGTSTSVSRINGSRTNGIRKKEVSPKQIGLRHMSQTKINASRKEVFDARLVAAQMSWFA